VHLFILYWGMLSFITPPVALGAYAAASIAGASPIQTGFAAMKLGSIIYFIPFIFVLDTSLLLQGSALETAAGLLRAGLGIWFLVAGLQGYLQGFGAIPQLLARIALSILGLGIAFSFLLF
jgi:TRAP-type uncharacterized transport system fused permease subunit